ncbi:MAG: MarR family winged helix-turn-helix transcriptional regulator [Solirubrobacterales bacterium]
MTDDWQIHGEERPLPALLGELKERALEELHARLGDEGYPDIRPGHGCVFRFIEVEGSRLTQIAGRAGMTKQTVGEVVADLEGLGYLERVPDPEDGRAKIIRLSARGWDAQAAALRIFADIERRWARAVGDEPVAELRKTTEAILASELAVVGN